ncbi:hypothetical protein Zmor_017329 [Zophobas morio]|uniref:Uncharacterized protein n=1 Tax=Zophobas morio TaxID=2755281 RepID=A0AA38I727_9CUCU|nr:hypothetical protein Zmor_016655 [Zophobas morio]KAJ3651279.1 hypothetical protein Zmor_017329 [Zophobas morio]
MPGYFVTFSATCDLNLAQTPAPPHPKFPVSMIYQEIIRRIFCALCQVQNRLFNLAKTHQPPNHRKSMTFLTRNPPPTYGILGLLVSQNNVLVHMIVYTRSTRFPKLCETHQIYHQTNRSDTHRPVSLYLHDHPDVV